MSSGPGIYFMGRFFNYKFNLFNTYQGIQIIYFFLSEFYLFMPSKEFAISPKNLNFWQKVVHNIPLSSF